MSSPSGNDPRPDPDHAALLGAVARGCPSVERPVLEELVSRLDEDYVRRYAPEQIARHLGLACAIGPGCPARVELAARPDGSHEVLLVAPDCFGEFAVLCGLLLAHGLSIESGEVHTLRPPPLAPARAGSRGRRAPLPARIVDIFNVRPRAGRAAPAAAQLEGELQALVSLLLSGAAAEARERLDRLVAESLEEVRGELARTVHPVEIEFDNEGSASWTRMRVRGRDAPAFLYALARALAMRQIYVHAVRIGSKGAEVEDEFEIAHRDGRKIADAEDQQTLRLAVVLVKQFTHFLPQAPDPACALRSFDQLLDRLMATGARSEALALLSGEAGLRPLARLLGSSEFLFEDFLRGHVDHLAPILTEWRTRPLYDRASLLQMLARSLEAAPSWEEWKRRLNGFKDEELLRIDMKHLLDPEVSAEAFAAALTQLAEAVLETALAACRAHVVELFGEPRLADGRPCPVSVLGLGKFGGAELGYASDLEVLVVYEGGGREGGMENGEIVERLVQELAAVVEAREEGIFHLDLRLRPHGGKGPLASPFDLLGRYYRPGGDAHPFERQALIKLRFVAGDEALGRRIEAFRDAYVWSDEPWDLGAALRLRERQVSELVPAGRFNVKLSRGGLVDVEYAAQYLQLQAGRAHPELRSPQTLGALAALAACGLLSAPEHATLREGYLFWRGVADALRMVRGQASDLLLPAAGSDELRLLARRLGYPGRDWSEAAAALDRDVDRHRLGVRSLFDRRFRG